MIASQPANQEIDEAIKRLQKKMQAVSESLDPSRSRMRSAQKKAGERSRKRSGTGGASRLLKYLFILLLLCATSFVVAQIAKGYISLDETKRSEPTDMAKEEKAEKTGMQQPATEKEKSDNTAGSPMPAKFSMQSANYDIVKSELGPVLDIAITVANIGGAAGRPELFKIELVDEANKQLMKWPMAVSGAVIPPQQQMVYKTRLVEPPANFKNIRVTMKK